MMFTVEVSSLIRSVDLSQQDMKQKTNELQLEQTNTPAI